jgi:hypothetical protein
LSHIVQRVTLVDSEKLYRFLGRTPSAQLAARCVEQLRTGLPDLGEEALRALAALEHGWARQRRVCGVPVDVTEAHRFLVALNAVAQRDPTDRRDLRTFSSQATGDSKLVETQAARVVQWMVEAERIPRGLSQEEALVALGLERYAHPVLVAGPIRFAGCDASSLTYVGIAPDQIDDTMVADPAATLLTVENFASFNRHVREVRGSSELVIYTGGFPSRSVVRLVRRISSVVGAGLVWHWGDIDPGGVRIADHIARTAAPGLRLHLMEPELAIHHGHRMPAEPTVGALNGSTDIARLATFLASDHAAHLEQEAIDPAAVSVFSECSPFTRT